MDQIEEVCKSEFTIVHVVGPRGAGNDRHHYKVTSFDGMSPPKCEVGVTFQHGNPATAGVNGIRIEDLLIICAHRLTDLQAGKFPCSMNQSALESIEAAITALDRRTEERRLRGVSGTNVK